MNIIKKVIEIVSCFECPHCQSFGEHLFCMELDKKLSKKGKIPKNCPLDDYEEEIPDE